MRLFVEIFVIGALLYFGWEKRFRDCLPENVRGVAKATPPPINASAAPHQPFVRDSSAKASAAAGSTSNSPQTSGINFVAQSQIEGSAKSN